MNRWWWRAPLALLVASVLATPGAQAWAQGWEVAVGAAVKAAQSLYEARKHNAEQEELYARLDDLAAAIGQAKVEIIDEIRHYFAEAQKVEAAAFIDELGIIDTWYFDDDRRFDELRHGFRAMEGLLAVFHDRSVDEAVRVLPALNVVSMAVIVLMQAENAAPSEIRRHMNALAAANGAALRDKLPEVARRDVHIHCYFVINTAIKCDVWMAGVASVTGVWVPDASTWKDTFARLGARLLPIYGATQDCQRALRALGDATVPDDPSASIDGLAVAYHATVIKGFDDDTYCSYVHPEHLALDPASATRQAMPILDDAVMRLLHALGPCLVSIPAGTFTRPDDATIYSSDGTGTFCSYLPSDPQAGSPGTPRRYPFDIASMTTLEYVGHCGYPPYLSLIGGDWLVVMDARGASARVRFIDSGWTEARLLAAPTTASTSSAATTSS